MEILSAVDQVDSVDQIQDVTPTYDAEGKTWALFYDSVHGTESEETQRRNEANGSKFREGIFQTNLP
jgi:hypothetical protein